MNITQPENRPSFTEVLERMEYHASDSPITHTKTSFLLALDPNRDLTPPEVHEFVFNVVMKIKIPYDRHMLNLKTLLDSVMLHARVHSDTRLREALGEDIIRDISGTFIAAHKLISPLINQPIQEPIIVKMREDFKGFGRVVGMITDALATFYGHEGDSTQIRHIAQEFQKVNNLPELPKPSGRKTRTGKPAVNALTVYVATRADELYQSGEFNNYTEVAKRMISEIEDKPTDKRSDVQKKFLRDMTGKEMKKKGEYSKRGDYLSQCVRRFKASQSAS